MRYDEMAEAKARLNDACEDAPASQCSPVVAANETLAVQLAKLGMLVGSLRERLEPVLRADGAERSGAKVPDEPSAASPLVREMRKHESRAREMQHEISLLLDQIDL